MARRKCETAHSATRPHENGTANTSSAEACTTQNTTMAAAVSSKITSLYERGTRKTQGRNPAAGGRRKGPSARLSFFFEFLFLGRSQARRRPQGFAIVE